MAQFDVYANINSSSKKLYPFLVDVQSNLLDSLETRLVIPLILRSNFGNITIKNLTPILLLNEQEFILLTPQIAAINKKHLGKLINNCKSVASRPGTPACGACSCGCAMRSCAWNGSCPGCASWGASTTGWTTRRPRSSTWPSSRRSSCRAIPTRTTRRSGWSSMRGSTARLWSAPTPTG